MPGKPSSPRPSSPANKGDKDASANLVRRRRVVGSLISAVIGSAIGYQGYPWLVGDRRQELAEALRRGWEDFKRPMEYERERWARIDKRRDEVQERLTPLKPRPIVLDTAGREYEQFLQGLSLRYIKPIELIRPHFNVRGLVSNQLPPRSIWRNIIAPLKVADELRHLLGVPLQIIASAYRCPAYNAACSGAASQSYHMSNMALDLVFDCAPAKVVAAAEALRAKGFFTGGIGRYANFTHVDTRGKKADWGRVG